MPDAKAKGRAGSTGKTGKKPANAPNRRKPKISLDGDGSSTGAPVEHPTMTAEQVAERAGVSVGTLKRWVKAGAIPGFNGEWTAASAAHARIVAQLRRSGQTLEEIALAAEDGRLALGTADSLFASEGRTYTLKEASKASGIDPDLAERLWISLGFSTESLNYLTERDIEATRRVVEVLNAGVPLGALLQVIRVAAKSFADIADAEARLIRMWVHEPLLQQGASGEEVQQVMGNLVESVLPHLSPMFDYMHTRFLQQFTEQVQIENVQSDVTAARGHLNVAICFVDIVGFTRYTEEAGVEKAFEQADQLRHHIETTLPDTARLIKLTGDGAMVVGSEPTELARWAAELADDPDKIFRLRIGLDYGEALYRDGDYFGGAINMAARVLNRADADEALATTQLKNQIKNRAAVGLRFQSIGRVRLKGFDEPVELFRMETR
ncbi:MAG: guanylate cyclase [Actinobacteria bacterium]|nr:guanylate cyclase [Actinomycetota bacterium]